MGTAMQGLDELIGFLLEEISLRGEQGATQPEIRRLVNLFYHSHGNHHSDGNVDSYDQNDGDVAPPNRQPLIDSRLLEKVWSWLIVHKDISVEKKKKVIVDPVRNEDPVGVTTGLSPDSSHMQDEQIAQQNSSQNVQHIGSGEDVEVLRTTEERMWHALTGHGVDYKRIPVMEFSLLSMIGAAGPKGIRQPDLVMLSGQDNRSLPHRTDELKRKGYIEKKQIRLTAHASSLCTLRRFVVEHKKLNTAETVKDWNSPDVLFKEIFDGGFLDSLKFLDITLQILKEVGTMSAETFRKRLGLTRKLWERRASNTLLRYMEAIGCVRRFHKQSQGLIIKSTLLRSVTYLQHPDPETRAKYATLAKRDARYYSKRKLHAAITEAVEDVGFSDMDADDSDTPAEPNDVLQQATSAIDSVNTRLLPRWDPERPLLNVLYQLADEHGSRGISSMDFASLAGGDFWKRPLDHTLAHLTDLWQDSQPPHLRHLTIVRDTAMSTRTLHYQYRTYGNFSIAVEEGDSSWDAVNNGNQTTNKKSQASAPAAIEENVDSWGFPTLKTALIFGRDGIATVSECRHSFKFDAEKEKPADYREHDVEKPRSYQRRLKAYFADNRSAQLNQYAISHVLLKRMNLRNPNAKVPKRDAVFEMRCRKLAVHLARREIGLVETDNDSVVQASAPTATKHGRAKKKAKLIRKQTKEIICVPSLVPAESSEKVSIANIEKMALSPTTEVEMNLCTERQNTPGIKRSAPPDSDESRPSKMQKIVTSDNALDDPTLEIRVGQIELELLAMSRPGIYINPPHRMEKTRGRPLKKLIMIVKHKGLHTFSWFGPSTDTGSSAELAIEQIDRVEREQALPSLPTVSASVSNDVEPNRKRKYLKASIPNSVVKTASQRSSGSVQSESGTIRPKRPVSKARLEDSNAENANVTMAILNKDSAVRVMSLTPQSASPTSLQPILRSVLSPIELLDPGSMKWGRARPVSSDTGKADDISMTMLDAAVMTSESVLPIDVTVPTKLGFIDIPTPSEQTPRDEIISNSGTQDCESQPKRYRMTPNLDHNSELWLPSTVTRLVPQVPSTPRKNGVPALSQELVQQLDQLNGIPTVVADSSIESVDPSVSPNNRPPNRMRLLAEAEKSRKRYAHKRKSGVLLGAGTLNFKRSQIIMKIMEQAGGVFPGNRELWYPFMVAVRKIEPNSNPDPNTVARAVKNLISFGKVRKVAFAFTDRHGATHTRHIITLPNISLDSDIVKATQREMIELYPKPYVPKEVEIDPVYREQWAKEQIRREMRGKMAVEQAAAAERAARNAALVRSAPDPADDFIDGITGGREYICGKWVKEKEKTWPAARRETLDF